MNTSNIYHKFKSKIHSIFSVLILLSMLYTAASSPSAVKAQVIVLPAQMNKSFLPISIIPSEISTLEIEIFNPNLYELTDMSWIDNLVAVQPGIYIADDPNITNTCGGDLTADPGGTTISLTGGSVDAATLLENGSCLVRVDVSSITPGNLINRIPVNALTATGDQGVTVTNTSPVEETLNVTAVQTPSIVKGFAPNTIWVGQTSVLTINITNNDSKVTLTEAALTDTLPTGVELASPLNVTLTNCGGATSTASAGGDTITLNNATIAPGATCRIQANVTSFIDDAYTNTIPVGNIETGDGLQTKQGVTNGSPASANLNVQAVGIQKSFSPTTIQAGETSQLTITLLNPTGENYTGVNLDDVLPGTVLEVVENSAATTCTADGSLSTDPLLISTTAPRTVSLTGGIIRAGNVVTPGSCTITVTVQAPLSAPDATYTNTIPANAMTTDQGITNPTSASANLTTEALSIDISKNFNPDRIQAGGTTTLTITLRNQTTSPYTGVNVIDDLANVESGLLVADPSNASTTCGGTLTADPGSTIISLVGGTIPAVGDGGGCTITVTITTPNEDGNDADTLTNRIDANTASSN